MNLAFELQKDKSLRESWLCHSFRIAGLWNVQRFPAVAFYELLEALVGVSVTLTDHKNAITKSGGVPTSVFKPFHARLELIYKSLIRINLNYSAKAAGRLLEQIHQDNAKIQVDNLRQSFNNLVQSIKDELEDRLVLLARSNRAEFYDKKGTILGADIITELSDLKEDANEAGNCFALARYISCAFHLMRIIEYLVHRFAEKLDVGFDRENDSWGVILGKCQTKIGGWAKGTPGKKQYSACCKSMDGMRPWRNDLSHIHLHQQYTEEHVRDLMSSVKLWVKEFMKLPAPPS